MKKSTGILLAVLLIAALVASGVFLSQKGDLQKQVDDLTAQVTNLTAELDTAKGETKAAAEQAATAATEAETLLSQKDDLQKQVDDLTAQVTTLTAELDTAKGEATATAEQATTAATEAETLLSQKSDLQKQVDDLTAQVTKLTTELDTAKGEAAATAEQAATAATEAETLLSQKGDLQKQVDDLTAQVATLTAELDTIKNAAATAAEQAETLLSQKDDLQKKADDLTAQVTTLKAELDTAKDEAAAAVKEAEALKKQAAEMAAAEEAAAKEAAEKAAAEKAENSKYKIGILAPAVTHGWVAGVAYNAEYQAKALADIVEYKIATSSNAEEMTAQLDDLLTWGAQAIVAFPQWEGMEVPIQAAIDKGVVVVNFDIVINAKGIYLVTGDNESMGVEGAKYIVDKIGKTGTVIALPVPTSGSVSQLRMKGFMDTIKEIAPDMTVIEYATKFTREDGLKDFTDILAANPQIDAVYSLDDETSIGVLQAISDANRTDIKVITGGGGSQGYFKMMPENKDIWIASALYSPLMVRDAVDVAVAVLKGEEVDPVKVIPTTIVDRTNYEQFLDPDSVY